jgi:hypothetical protein
MEHTVLGHSTSRNKVDDLNFSKAERQVLRRLAGKVSELASRPVEAEKRIHWTKHNDLEPERPLIFCDPENGWNEIIPEKTLLCVNELARTWEMFLRKEIFWATKMGDDKVIEPYFNVPYSYSESDWGMHHVQIGGTNFGAYTWDAPLKDYEKDLPLLKFPQITVDFKMTDSVHQLAESIFGDLLSVRVKGMWWWTLGLTWPLINLRGIENYMLDFYLYPEYLHRLMEILRDGHMNKLDFLEANNLLPDNTDMYVGSGGFGYTTRLPQGDNTGKTRLKDMWGFCESQETVSVAPELFAEFVLPYQLPILERFGLNCYGCCEGLDERWEWIRKIPNLRRVSVSPWANEAKMAEQLGSQYIFSRKLHPAKLALAEMDEDSVRSELRRALEVATANNCVIELLMKDNNTLGNNPMNVINWCRIAREEIDKL